VVVVVVVVGDWAGRNVVVDDVTPKTRCPPALRYNVLWSRCDLIERERKVEN
jgi:hypothetical protein